MSKPPGRRRGESLANIFGSIKSRLSRLRFIFRSGHPETEDDVPPDALTQLERLNERSSLEQDLLAKRLYRLIQFDSRLSHEERFQKTRRDRFPELNEMLAVEIRIAFPPDQIIHVHDMAASSAITSMQLFECLSHERPNVRLHASDFFDTLYVVSPPQTRWQVVFNRALAPVQFVAVGLAVSGRRLPTDGIAKNLLRRWLVARALPRALEILSSALYGPAGQEADEARRCVKNISMFDPRCRVLAQIDTRFTLGREDLFDPSSGPYDVVRVMNALSPSFPHSQICKVLLAIHHALHDGGLLVVGAGGEENTDATIFRRSTNGFIAIKDVGSGSMLRRRIERVHVERSDTRQPNKGGESSEAERGEMVMG
jgi:hypothetical protein